MGAVSQMEDATDKLLENLTELNEKWRSVAEESERILSDWISGKGDPEKIRRRDEFWLQALEMLLFVHKEGKGFQEENALLRTKLGKLTEQVEKEKRIKKKWAKDFEQFAEDYSRENAQLRQENAQLKRELQKAKRSAKRKGKALRRSKSTKASG
jgi:hypothetical protein